MSELGQQLISIVRRKAAETPDHVYQRPAFGACLYIEPECPGCLIGQALFEAGVIGMDFCRSPYNAMSFNSVIAELSLDLDHNEDVWLCTVQRTQDKALSWGEAVALADHRVPL